MDASEVSFSEVMDPMRKVVASGTLDRADWNAELVRAISLRPFGGSRTNLGEGFRSVG